MLPIILSIFKVNGKIHIVNARYVNVYETTKNLIFEWENVVNEADQTLLYISCGILYRQNCTYIAIGNNTALNTVYQKHNRINKI